MTLKGSRAVATGSVRLWRTPPVATTFGPARGRSSTDPGAALGWRGLVRRSGGKLSTWVDPVGGGGVRGPWELRIMNSELRKKTAECGETWSAKRTQTSRKRKAAKMKSPKSKVEIERRPRKCGMRIEESEPQAQATGQCSR